MNNLDKLILDALGERCPLPSLFLSHIVHGYVRRAIFDGLDQLRSEDSRGDFRRKCSGWRRDCLKAQVSRFVVLENLRWRFGNEN